MGNHRVYEIESDHADSTDSEPSTQDPYMNLPVHVTLEPVPVNKAQFGDVIQLKHISGSDADEGMRVVVPKTSDRLRRKQVKGCGRSVCCGIHPEWRDTELLCTSSHYIMVKYPGQDDNTAKPVEICRFE